MNLTSIGSLSLDTIREASLCLRSVVRHTPLEFHPGLSERYEARVFLKREDLQVVRSYKLRGAFFRMTLLTEAERATGVVCASAGNHAQGVAYACSHLGVEGKIFMPVTTPKQKVSKVRYFGGEKVQIQLVGDTYDEAGAAARECALSEGRVYVHPFDDFAVMAGQGTVGLEILEDLDGQTPDWVFMPVGGGGLSSGVGTVMRALTPGTRIIGVEPAGAAAMLAAFNAGKVVTLGKFDPFVDGAAVARVGDRTFEVCRQVLDRVVTVPEGEVCASIIRLYNEDAIVAEPAGVLSLAALEQFKDAIRGKTVVCVLSGGNNDVMRMEEMKERAFLHQGLKHYFLIRFPQRAGALREFLVHVLGPSDDITRFEYTKKNNRESGPALVGIEVERKEDFDALIQRMDAHKVNYQWVNEDPSLFQMLV